MINDKLRLACENGDLFAVKKCIDQGANIHARNDSALIWAAGGGHLDIVKYLIKHGANIHAEDGVPLRWAVYKGYLEVANVIRKAAGDEYKCHKCLIRSTCLELCKDFRNGH